MATIQRPVTKTVISTTGWGIPITDQVNALSAGRLIAHKAAIVNQPNIPMATTVDVTGQSLTFTAVAGHNYQLTHSIAFTAAIQGIWCCGFLVWPGMPDTNYLAMVSASPNVASWGVMSFATGFVGPNANYQFTPGSVTLRQQVHMAGTATTVGVSGWCRIAVVDLGPY